MEFDLTKPLIPKVWMGKALQSLEYEGLNMLSFNCERFGHRKETCPSSSKGSSGQTTANSGAQGQRGEEIRVEESR